MGALTSNRKRRDDYFAVNCKSPAFNSSIFDSHPSKKPRISPSMNQTPDSERPNPVKSAIFRFFQYPDLKSQLKREPHAPVRPPRFGFSANSKSSGLKVSNSDRDREMGNLLTAKYEWAKRTAFETFRYTEKDKEVIEVVDDDDEKEVYEDSSIEEVEALEDRGEQKWKESNGDVEDWKKDDGDFRPSSSSAVTNVSNENLKVENAKKLSDSLSLSRKLDAMDISVHKKLLSSAERRNDKLNSLKFYIELEEKRRQMHQSLRPQKKVEAEKDSEGDAIKKDLVTQAFKPLSKEEETEVSCGLSNSNRRKLLVTHEESNIDITGELLQCLKPGAWLNDEVINVYLVLLKEREKREPQKFLKCHFFNTFFYKKLISGKGGYNFQSVRRWTSQKKLGYFIFDCDKIFVPIHKEVHWCLAVINKKDEKFQYLDSLGGIDNRVMNVLARYFVDEVKDKSGKVIDVSSWEQEFVENLPEQENGFDCGVFMIKYADFYSRDIGLCFKQEHMPYFRRRTAKEILRLKAE